ncbi:MAG: hypothetical protein AMXMBFR4_01050 [Candidatus Hydrogenedentota bacterium]
MLVLVLVVFGDVFITAKDLVASSVEFDAKIYFAPVREFAYAEILSGNLPLWNPYIFSGAPFLAGMQSALLYPLNLHYLILPLAKSLNVEITLHVFLLGLFMFAWARDRGLSTTASAFSATALMFSGPYFLHVMAGHLTLLAALAWTPLAFLAVDRLLDTERPKWMYVGALALTMSILAGHPQGVFYTMAVLIPYAVLRSLRRSGSGRVMVPLAGLFVAPLFLAAAQLWPALAFSGESVRAGGISYAAATSYSFPPENLLTLIVPAFFGDHVHTSYWGRWAYWEMSVFLSVSALSLAMYAIFAGDSRTRWMWLGFAVASFLVGLGRYTPLSYLLYYFMPGFASFRSPSKVIFFTVLFLCLLAGHGLDSLVRRPGRARIFAAGSAVLGGGLFATAMVIYVITRGDGELWRGVLNRMYVPGDVWWEFSDTLVQESAANAVRSLMVSALTLALLGGLYWARGKTPWAAYGVAAVGLIELLVFARASRPVFDLASTRVERYDAMLRERKGDGRVLDVATGNYLMPMRVPGMWGYDPAGLRRYRELLAHTQGPQPLYAINEVRFNSFHPLFAMFRCYLAIQSSEPDERTFPQDNPLPRFLVLNRYRIIDDAHERIAAVCDPSFDPRQEVILESQPDPLPDASGATGSVTVLAETTDCVEIEAEMSGAGILLMTDTYASDWRAVPLHAGPQAGYAVMPANHALRAIPLSPGKHRIRLEYDPPAFRYGMWVSVASFVAWSGGWAYHVQRRARPKP